MEVDDSMLRTPAMGTFTIECSSHRDLQKIKKYFRKVDTTMALIQVTPELLTGKANELRGLKSNHDEAMTKMRTLIMGLNEIWKGDAQAAYVAKYESMQGTFTNFSQMIEDYAKLMDTAAQKLQETDTALQSTMNSFGV